MPTTSGMIGSIRQTIKAAKSDRPVAVCTAVPLSPCLGMRKTAGWSRAEVSSVESSWRTKYSWEWVSSATGKSAKETLWWTTISGA